MSNFITVTKKENVEWLEVQAIIRDHIQKKFLESGKLILEAHAPAAVPQEEETDTIRQIKGIWMNTSDPLLSKTEVPLPITLFRMALFA